MKKKTENKPFKFTVKLNKWRCGSDAIDERNRLGKGDTFLLNKEGYKCCLGFACHDAGYRGKMTLEGTPSDLRKAVVPLSYYDTEHNILVNSEFSNRAMIINDDVTITVEQKIKQLKKLGKEHNIEIEFV